ncbi:MAG: Fe-S cluster assembly sulfur transfer protein SufU [Bdellovibrionales bacterium]
MTGDLPMDDLRDLYQDLILDHGRNPRNFRVVEGANHEALGHNPLCGDRLMLYLAVDEDGVIRDAGFQGSGCAISVASASMMTGMLIGKTTEQAEALFSILHAACTGQDAAQPTDSAQSEDVDRLKALSGVRNYPMRVKCATLAWHTMQAALKSEKKVTTE